MTLKLSTFLLPSNQFALIAEFDQHSEIPYRPENVAGLEEFGKRCGAVDVLIVNYPTRVEDAILPVDYPADRQDGPASPAVVGPNGEDLSPSESDWGVLSTGDELVYGHLLAGHDFSPAGLVKLTDEEKAELCAQAPYLADQAEQLPGPIGRTDLLEDGTVDCPGCTGDPADHPARPWTPQLGETVVVAVEGSVRGTETLGFKLLLGQELYVVSSEPFVAEEGPAAGEPVVWLDTDPTEDGLILLRVADLLPLSA